MERLTETIKRTGIDEEDPMRVFALDYVEEGVQQERARAEEILKQERARAEERRNKEKLAQAKQMLEDGLPIDVIMRYTGLSREEIEQL